MANPKTVSELLGHASVSITLDRYVHPSKAHSNQPDGHHLFHVGPIETSDSFLEYEYSSMFSFQEVVNFHSRLKLQL